MRSNALNDARSTLASLPIYAQGLAGRDNKVKVIFDPRASTAGTDGVNVVLPALPLPSSDKDLEAADDLALLVYGFIPHEIGHVRHTDFEALKPVKGDLPLLKGLVNAIEDPRQEVEIIDDYPGTRKPLDALADACIGREGFYNPLTEQDPPAWLVSAYTLYVLRDLVRGQTAFRELAKQSRDAVSTVLGEGFTTRLDVLLHTQGPKLANTADAVALGRKILEALKEEAQKPPPPPSPPAGDQGDAGADGDASAGQDDGTQSQQAGNGAGGQDDADGADQSASSTGPTQQQQDAMRDALQSTEDQAVQDLGDQVAKAIADAADQIQPDGQVSDDTAVASRQLTGGKPRLGGQFDADASLQQSARLRALMRNEFQSLQLERDHESTRGKFNNRRAHRTSSGDRRVFVHLDERRGLNTAVFLLADVSGSMGGAPITLTSEALYATATALNGLSGVSCAIGTFPVFGTVLGFGEQARRDASRFGLQATGSTPLAEGLMWAGRQLVARHEPRKIMLVLTDGQPDNASSAKAQVNALERAGVEMLGLGIRHEAVRTLIQRSAVINSIEEISGAMLEMLGKTLRLHLAA